MRRAFLLFPALLASACVGPPPEACIQCGSQCVDTRVDAQNCGSCGTLCGLGKACSDSVCVAAVSSVTLDPASGALAIGATLRLTAIPRDGTGNPLTGRTIVWTSSSPTVAFVALDGLVTGLAAGTAQITATVDGQSASATVTVTPPPIASIRVNAPSSTIGVGSTLQAVGEALDAQGNVLDRPLAWSSSNTTIASVTASGLVTALKAGTAVITAGAEGKSGSKTITIVGTATLSVTATSPSSNATNVSIDGNVVITFSENIDASTALAATFSVTRGGTAIATSRAVSGKTVTLTPAAPLTEFKTVYVVTVSTAVRSSTGNALASANTFSFTTPFWDPNYYYRVQNAARPSESLDTNPTTLSAQMSATANTAGQYWHFGRLDAAYSTCHSAISTSSQALECANGERASFFSLASSLSTTMYWQAVAVSGMPGAYSLRTLILMNNKSLSAPVGVAPVPVMLPSASDTSQYWSFTRLAHR